KVPPELEQIVLWALNKDPVHRPADDDQFITALEQAKEAIISGTRGERTASFAAVGGAPSVLPPAPARPTPPPEIPPAALAVAPGVEEAPPGATDPGRSGNSGAGGRAWLWVLLAALLIGGAAAAYLLTRPKQVQVPLVVNNQQSVAIAKIDNAGLAPSVVPEPNTAASGTVVSQNPLAGQKADKGSIVRLAVSSGPGNAPVPTVVGLTKAAAEKSITKAGLKVGSVQSRYSASVAMGRATGTDPPAGNSLPVGDAVTLFVSLGPAPVKVPDVTGETESAAKATLTGLGLSVTTTKQPSSTQTPGTVLSQSRTGTAPANSTINLVIAQAPPMVKVPTVTGDTATAADKALKAAGFTVAQTTTNVTTQAQDNTVVSQQPGGGTKAKKGSAVAIVVGKYTAPTQTTTTGASTTPTTTTP
ncbi:MAG TPA: PASTA domain-containing protein, partial [Solirubrobacteraceae bacterium]